MCNLAKLKSKANHLTTKPGIYMMKNDKNKIIYIGKAKNLKNRVTSYFRKNKSHNEKIIKMLKSIFYNFI